jgi:CRISPR-associated endonuclease/helicase Cas3
VGTSVIILTATLPSKTRQELMEAYGATTIPEDPIDFPRISLVSENNASIIKAGEVESREIQLNWLDKEPHSILSLLENKLENSGCAAVICNTVKRAQDVFEVVKESFSEDEVILFHSRFPYCWRKDIEEKIKLQFGKKVENRPERAIVVATQVIEQSLDLDFDLMITDLAPVDLLIQRIGRLHRHQSRQNPPQRPKGLEAPICTICAPNSDDPASQPDFGSSAYIYDAYFLYRTLLTLKERESLFLPNDTDDLIQSVYTMQRSSFISDEQWENLNDMKAEMMEKQANSMQNANNYLVSYSNKHFLGSLQSPFSDDIDSLSRKVFVAPTREISPSIQIVCLVQDDNGLHILNEKTIPIDIEKPLTHREIRACLKATATINQWSIMDYFFNKSEKPPQSFQNSAALRWHYPVVFTNGKFTTDDFILFLDQQRGLYFEKREN